MRKVKKVLGQPVVDTESGKQIGTVKDLWVDSAWCIQGVLLESKTWFSGSRSIVWENISSFGEDAVMVSGEHAVGEEELPEGWLLLHGSGKIIGFPLLTEDGQQLGQIEDVYFSPEMDKRIIGFELSEGFLTDVRDGRKWLTVPEETLIGEDVIMVPLNSVDNLQELTTNEE